VRELHQITCMKYNIAIASEVQTPSGKEAKQVFILEPPEKEPWRIAHPDPGSSAQTVRQSWRRVEAEAV